MLSCSHSKLPKIRIPEPPKVLPVYVENNAISGNSLDNVVENHMQIWFYAFQLRALLGDKNLYPQK